MLPLQSGKVFLQPPLKPKAKAKIFIGRRSIFRVNASKRLCKRKEKTFLLNT